MRYRKGIFMSRLFSMLLLAATAGAAMHPGGSAMCVGGTITSVQTGKKGEVFTSTPDAFVFVASPGTVRIPYDKINLMEYGQEVSRRVMLAWMVSPMFLLLKSRKHLLTLGFQDAEGPQQRTGPALDKRVVRAALAALEARSGRMVTFLDADARKFHRGGEGRVACPGCDFDYFEFVAYIANMR